MKKVFLIAAIAAATQIAGAKDASDLRIYINPGHGGWSANDRPMPLVNVPAWTDIEPDTLGFFESNTNLWKGFGLLEELVNYGFPFDRSLNQTGRRGTAGAARDMSNNIVMSRVKSGPYHPGIAHNQSQNSTWSDPAEAENQYTYNRTLSEICQEVEANNFDMFISIHSNATNDNNIDTYPLFIYRGYDTPQAPPRGWCSVEHQTTSRAMADAAWDYIYANTHQKWTAYATSKYIKGDVNFYGSGSTNGGMNNKLPDGTQDPNNNYYGYLGVLKHGTPGYLAEGYFHTYQPSRHRAMNRDVCRVEGTAYARGMADFFGIHKSEKGIAYFVVRDMHQKFTHAQYHPNTGTEDIYMPLNGATVELRDAAGNLVAAKTTDNYWNGAAVFLGLEPGKYTALASFDGYKDAEPYEFTVKADADVYGNIFLENKDYVSVAVNYPDPVTTEGIKAAPEYTFSTEYTAAIPALEGKYVRRMLSHKGLIYILALSNNETNDKIYANRSLKPEATLLVFDTATKEIVQLSTEGTSGVLADVADIQLTADGFLLACNWTKTQNDDSCVDSGDTRGTFYIYKWDNDDKGRPAGKPEVFIGTQASGTWMRAYPGSFCYSGTSQAGRAFIFMPNVYSPHGMRSTLVTVADGRQDGETNILAPRMTPGSGTYLSEGYFGTYNMQTSPADDEIFYVTTEKQGLYEMSYDMGDGASYTNKLSINGGRSAAFSYAGAKYMTLATTAGLKLYEVSSGMAKAKDIALLPADVCGTVIAATAEPVVALDDFDNVTDAWIELFTLTADGLTKYSTRGLETAHRNEYAYGLTLAATGDDSYTLAYKLTGDVASAELVLSADGADDMVLPLDGTSAGDNSYVLDRRIIDYGKQYAWAVRTCSKPNTHAGQYFADNNGNLAVRGGVVPVTDPEADSYGYVTVAHGKNYGIDLYVPDGKKVASRLHAGDALFGAGTTNQSNPLRGTERDGKVLFASWGNDACGIVAFDPANPQAALQGLFAGDKSETGCYVYDGANLGGGTSGIAYADGTIYSFSEDHEGLNGKGATENSIVAYNVGSAWTITEAPRVVGHKDLLANTNVDLVTAPGGMLASQVRGASKNTADTPAFIYIALPDERVTFTADLLADSGNGALDECNSAVAMTADGTTLAVAETGRVLVYSVKWIGNAPRLTYRYAIATPAVGWGTMRFDAADNLHYYQREQGGYHAYSLADVYPTSTTPARASLTVTGIESGVYNVVAERDTDARVTYFRLNGLPAASPLAPGVYIRRKGLTSTKIVVK